MRAQFRSLFNSFAVLLVLSWVASGVPARSAELRLATFNIDATPPVGSRLCFAWVPSATGTSDPVFARGIILLPADERPIVLVAVDWLAISNESHLAWRQAIAEAAGSSVRRVSVHTLHQHDAPGCDVLADRIARAAGFEGGLSPVAFERKTIGRVAKAVREAKARARRVTHVGAGQAKVYKVASNRRILGPDGKVKHVRFTACADPKIRAFPEGTIDPYTKVVSFWDRDEPIAILTYYATHPQSYYRTGRVSADFPGMARSMREKEVPRAAHIHFNGAGGNIGAGKYNDGSRENRPVLAGRLADGMKRAWEATEKFPIDGATLSWNTRDVSLPVSKRASEEELQRLLKDPGGRKEYRISAALTLSFARWRREGHQITISRLRIGRVDLLHLPGELFVEYQLAAQKLRPKSFVCTAAYGDYGPGYIGTQIAYSQGGYETSDVSHVSPRVEKVLMDAIEKLMK